MEYKKEIKIIVEHFSDQKWFTDALQAVADERDRRTRRASFIAARQAEFVGKTNRPEIEKNIGKEFDESEA
jgi:hypothetical protein